MLLPSDGFACLVAEKHDRLVKAWAVKQALVLEYRCPRGCLLLHVWNTPKGRLWYQPRHKLSREHALADTCEQIWRERTEDHFRVWKSRGGDFDQLVSFDVDPPEAGLSMNCDHVREAFASCEQLRADAGIGTPGRPVGRVVSNGDTRGTGAE